MSNMLLKGKLFKWSWKTLQSCPPPNGFVPVPGCLKKSQINSLPLSLSKEGIFSNDFVEVRADDSEIYLTNAANNKYFRIKRDGSDIDFDIYNGSSVSTKLMLTEDGILQGISNSEIKTSPIRIHTNTINQNTTIDSSENAVSGGPITIANGVTVTVDGDWTVV